MIRRRFTTLEEELNIIHLYTKDLLNFKQIRQKTGIEARWISEALHKHGVKVERLTDLQRSVNKILNNNKDLILKMYLEEKVSVEEISRRFDICNKPICYFLRKNNIEVKQFSANKYSVNSNYFETLNQESAYWLGFLFSDGYLLEKDNAIGMNLSVKDECVLEDFKKCLQSEAKILRFKPNGKIKKLKNGQIIKSGIISYFRFQDKKMADDLRKYGMKGKKSLTLEWPKIEEKFYYSFLRGYLDGDGCIYVNESKRICSVMFLGTKEFTDKLKEFVFKDTGIVFHTSKHTNIFRVYINSKPNILKLLDKLYGDNDGFPRLERKYNKGEEIREMLRKNPLRIGCGVRGKPWIL